MGDGAASPKGRWIGILSTILKVHDGAGTGLSAESEREVIFPSGEGGSYKNEAPRWCVTEGLGGKKRRNPVVPHRPASRSPGGKVISTRPMLQRDSGKI